jgi:signal transduction histidine kinase
MTGNEICWLVSGTHCRNEIQGKFLEKIEICLDCEPFNSNIDQGSIKDSLKVVNKQFKDFRRIVEERDREIEGISMELAIGLSEVFEALKEISSGNPNVKIPEDSQLDLIRKLKHMVNVTASDLGQMVDLSHEFAIGLAEHFDVLHRVSEGDLHARVAGTSEVELLDALKTLTNKMIDSTSDEITQRKEAQEKLKETLAELGRSNTDLEQFAYVASHDLQEPLRMISSYVQLLARRYSGKLDADADEFIGFAVDGAARMQRLINDLLTYSRMGRRKKPFEPTDVNHVLSQTVVNLKNAIEESHAVITNDALPTVMADEAQVSQLLQNLVSNAIKFRSNGPPHIHISSQQENGQWIFSVSDDGIGIDPQYHERIFAIFQRLHGRTEYDGTGIGLSVCKSIVERHGGKIWLESEFGKGSTFYFSIPNRTKGMLSQGSQN